MSQVSASTSTRTTMVVNFDLPDELRRVLADYQDQNVRTADYLPDEIIVTLAGVRVGKVNIHARVWDKHYQTSY